MKTATRFFPLMIAAIAIGMAGSVHAQGKGHHHGKKHYESHDRCDDGHRRVYHRDDHKHRHHHKHHADRYSDRRIIYTRAVEPCCYHTATVVHHAAPRYVYYRDYDVYHDLHRNVYITYSGRNWTVATSVPVVLQRVDRRRVVRMEVDYDRDDFHVYLAANRPAYRRIYSEF